MSKAASFATGTGEGAMSEDMRREIEAARVNGCVGSVLVSETDEVKRVWHLTVEAGTRCGFHTHVLNYFWTCHSNGTARNIFEDGTTRDDTYYAGEHAI